MIDSPGIWLVFRAEEDVQDVRVARGARRGVLAFAEQTSTLVGLSAGPGLAAMSTSARIIAAPSGRRQ